MSALVGRLARALLPSWRFFDEIEPAPQLWIRVSQREFGPWQRVVLVGPRAAGALWFNARGNLELAEHALLEQLLGDLTEPSVRDADDVERLTSYALVLRLARREAARVFSDCEPGARFQLKLTLEDTGRALAEDVLISRLLEL